MRTNIDIDDSLMSKALQAGPYKTKKEAVEAGLKLLARQAAYREILKWEGKLRWDGDSDAGAEGGAWPQQEPAPVPMVNEPRPSYPAPARKASRGRR